ncbi:MAG: hypothetical protein ACOYOT_09905 [Bacteroidales bacterium]
MRTKVFSFALLTLALLTFSCNKSDDALTPIASTSLKSAINENVTALNTALNTISNSAGFQILNDGSLKSATESPIDSLLTNQILLSDISGVYDYKMPSLKRGPLSSQRFFNKTGENSLMVVRLPEEKVKNWRSMLSYNPADTSLVNNYVVSLSEYEYKFHSHVGYSYKMASAINVKSVDAGVLKIQTSNNYVNGYKYASEFAFANGYKTICSYTTGDTIVSTYAITNGLKTLYEEKYTAIKNTNEFRHRERSFSLTIGDVQVIRQIGVKNSLDSAKVYVAGVLQTNAKVEIVDKTVDPNATTVTNKGRELKITFDDGTSSTFTQLAGAAIDNINSLFTAMRQVTFSTNVVDWIAWDIYKSKK